MAPPTKPRMGTPEYEEYLRQRRCGRKTQYSGPLVADNAATILSWISPELEGMDGYYCEYCDHWHVGHPYYRTMSDIVPEGTTRALRRMMKENDD